jgi:hypothetical protein
MGVEYWGRLREGWGNVGADRSECAGTCAEDPDDGGEGPGYHDRR